MSLSFIGKKSLGAAVPILLTLMANFDLPGLVGEIKALATITLNFVPPSVVGILALIAKLQAAIALGLQPPALTVQGDLIIKLGLLKAKLELLLQIKDLLLAAGVHAYQYEGTAEDFGAAVTGEFNPGPSQGGIVKTEGVYAVLLVVQASNSVTVNATKSIFVG